MTMPRIGHRARVRQNERRRREHRPDTSDQRRERTAPGPEDRALFSCRCGMVFQAQVVASVRCPHCGEPQAW